MNEMYMNMKCVHSASGTQFQAKVSFKNLLIAFIGSFLYYISECLKVILYSYYCQQLSWILSAPICGTQPQLF